MTSRREQVWVGLFVLIAAALLIGTVLAVAGTFSVSGVAYHSYFKSAGGLLPGATVRYGGMKAGKVETVRVDPQDSTRIEVVFSVGRAIPVKTDSVAKITSLGPLDENYVELATGTKGAALAPPGSEVKSVGTVGIGDIGDMIGNLAPVAQQVLQNLNQRLTELQVTVARVNDLLNDRNRTNISEGLGNLNAMLAEDRPKVSATLTNMQTASAKIVPLLDNLKTTMKQANDALSHIDSVVLENRQDIRTAVVELKQTLLTASSLMEQLKNTMDHNADNIDQILVNLRVTTENTKQLTDSLKNRPSILIRGNTVKDRKPGEKEN
ncbi:MAG: MlaD family protein [Candidatus Korobacteraceae bacterium]|jgi:phospholipid/cholesterol/gamma-HCH transport system substrate-binding protein